MSCRTVLSMVRFLFFGCNDSASTDSYTYCHTRSRHDARPICDRPPPQTAGSLTVRDRNGGAPVRSGAIFPDQPSPSIDELQDRRQTRPFVQLGDREERLFHLSKAPTRLPDLGFPLLPLPGQIGRAHV